MRLRKRQSFRAKPAVLWGLILFVVSQLLLAIVWEIKDSDAADPEFAVRRDTLQARRAETPDRPVLFVVGSSRTVMAFRPEILPPMHDAGGATVLPFNFSHHGAGPLVNLMELTRLLRAGQKPTWLVLELMPPFLAEHHFGEYLARRSANIGDMPLLARFVPWWRLASQLAGSWLAPAYSRRQDFVAGWHGGDTRPMSERIGLLPFGGAGSSSLPEDMSPAEILRQTTEAWKLHSAALSRFRIDPAADRALRNTLELCRREQIEVVLILTPESRLFQSWYAPAAGPMLAEYCANFTREFGVPIVDAADWVADADFTDGHHVLLRGASTFTERLGREVLVPLTAGYLHHTD